MEKISRRRSESYEAQIEDTVDRLMLVETFLFWCIQEFENMKSQLSMDPVLRLLVPIVDVMITQLWQLMRRWRERKSEVIKAVKEGLMKKKRVIEGNGFWIQVTYNKYVVNLIIHLHGGHGNNARIPNLGIPETVLRAMRMGWWASDASHDHDNPTMTTHHVWQAIAWLITMPGAEAEIYAIGVSIAKDGVKPRWQLHVNGFSAEWSSDVNAYREMVKLPKGLFEIAVLHGIFGDGSSKSSSGGDRKITLANDDYGALELIAGKLEGELNISRSISPYEGVWYYEVTGPSAKTFTEVAVKAMEELAPAVKRLYDLMASERYVLIHFRKWARIVKISKYILNERRVSFCRRNVVISFHG